MAQHDFILLDASGSMGNLWVEALSAINGYVKKLADAKVDTGVTLIVFDSDEPFKIIRDRITPATWQPVTATDAEPRGMTPLNDATARMVTLAKNGAPWGEKYDRVALVIMTDGHENHSIEYAIDKGGTAKIKAMLDDCRKLDWQVQFLGANFDNQAQAMSYGATRGATVQTSSANFGTTMNLMAGKRGSYGATGQSISWSEEEKAALASDEDASTKFTDSSAS